MRHFLINMYFLYSLNVCNSGSYNRMGISPGTLNGTELVTSNIEIIFLTMEVFTIGKKKIRKHMQIQSRWVK